MHNDTVYLYRLLKNEHASSYQQQMCLAYNIRSGFCRLCLRSSKIGRRICLPGSRLLFGPANLFQIFLRREGEGCVLSPTCFCTNTAPPHQLLSLFNSFFLFIPFSCLPTSKGMLNKLFLVLEALKKNLFLIQQSNNNLL